jgi:hypothetical protein
MSTQDIMPSENDILTLKDKLEKANRAAEYQRLKADLHDVTYKAVNTPNEFEGAMQMPDTDRVLKTKRASYSVIELIMERAKNMFSIRPVIGHVIALLVAGFVLFYIFNEIDTKWFVKYQTYFALLAQFVGAAAIIKSATRSLLLPAIALVFGSMAAHSLGAHELLFHFGRSFYEHMMVVGVIGLCMSVLNID